jgi:hypothetical protein
MAYFACLILSCQANALGSTCDRTFNTRPAHIVTWDWIDTLIYDTIFISTVAVSMDTNWLGDFEGAYSLASTQPQGHHVTGASRGDQFWITGVSIMFGYYSLLGNKLIWSRPKECSGLQMQQ